MSIEFRALIAKVATGAALALSIERGRAEVPPAGQFLVGAGKRIITPNPLLPVSIDGNATLQVTMTDAGEPGSSDAVAITVWNKSGGIWFSSKWDGTKTVEQLLGGGNLVVH